MIIVLPESSRKIKYVFNFTLNQNGKCCLPYPCSLLTPGAPTRCAFLPSQQNNNKRFGINASACEKQFESMQHIMLPRNVKFSTGFARGD